jgi:hypothetical protein
VKLLNKMTRSELLRLINNQYMFYTQSMVLHALDPYTIEDEINSTNIHSGITPPITLEEYNKFLVLM